MFMAGDPGCGGSTTTGSGGDGDNTSGFRNFVDGECTEVANKRIIDTPKHNPEQMKVADTLLKLRPFGLKLNLSSFSLDSNNQINSNQAVESQNHPKFNDYSSQPISEKLKAANFEATFLRIGKWERRKKNEGDLTAKCYFAKKKLVWEFLEGNLKNKIEIQWNDIIGMRAFIQDHKPGILEIELNKAPAFFEEIDPQPRKHTIWRLTTDFTGREASYYRRHYLVFPPGTLDKHYEKLLQCDQRLYALNQKRFPSLKTPYFDSFCNTLTFSSDYRSDIPSTSLALHFNFASVPSPLMATHPRSFKDSTSPISVMDFSHSDEFQHVTRSNMFDNMFDNRGGLWTAQEISSLPVIGPLNAAVSYQNYTPPSSAYGSNTVNNLLTNLEQHLFSDKQVGAYDEKYHMARVQSLNALVSLSQSQEEPGSEDSSQRTFYSQEISTNYGSGFGGQLALNNLERPVYQQLQVYQQPVALPPSLYSQNSSVQHAWENLTYTLENFGQDNSNNEGSH